MHRKLGKTFRVVAVALVIAVVVSVTLVIEPFGFLFPVWSKQQTSQTTTSGPACKAGPYEFSGIGLSSTSMMATLTNGGNASVTQDMLTVVLGSNQSNTVNLTTPSSLGILPSSIGPQQSSALQFNLPSKWNLAPGSYDASFEIAADSGILYSCSLQLQTSGGTEIQILDPQLTVYQNKTAVLDFKIRNSSQGLFTGGEICYVGQTDCPGGSSARFDPVPANESVPEHARFELASNEINGTLLFSLVLDVGVVYLFPVPIT